MGLIRTFVSRPATTVMMVAVFVVLGIVSYQRMVVDLLPELDFPIVQVICVYPGASPVEIESEMIKKIEDEVSNISDIDEIRSEINESYGYLIVQFELGVDVDLKALDVKDKVELIREELPDDAEDPVVAKYDPLSMPVIKIAAVSESMSERDLYEFADERLENEFGQVGGVAKVEILGGAARQVNVLARLPKLAQYGLTITDLTKALEQQNLDIPAGNIKTETREIGLRFKGEARSVEEIRNLAFPAQGHGIIRISDVARVEDGTEERDSVVRYRSENCVLLDVYKRSDANTIEVADGILGKLDSISDELPAEVSLKVADDTSVYIRDSVRNALSNIFYGVVLCGLILWIFLRDFRITLVAVVVIPTSIVSAFLLMRAFDFTINIMSLSALGISIGVLVANAIVVLENIATHMEYGKGASDAATEGAAEIAVAVMAAAGTNIVVFTPIAFMGGIVGQFFYQFGMTVVFATIFSLLASFSLTPMLSGVFFRGMQPEGRERLKVTRWLHYPLNALRNFLDRVRHSYVKSLYPVLRHPWITLLVTLAIFMLTMFSVRYIGGEFFPESDEGELNIIAQLPKGAGYKRALSVTNQIEGVITSEIPDDIMKDYTSQAGGENVGFDEVEVKVRLVEKEKREISDERLMYRLQEPLARIPGAEIYTRRGRRGPGESDLDIDVYGPDYDKLIELSEKMRKKAMETGNFRAVFNTYRPPKDEVHFYPNGYKRSDYMAPNALLGTTLRYSVEGEDASVLRIGGEDYDINVRLAETDRDSTEDLKTYRVRTSKGLAPLSQLGAFERTKSVATLYRKDKRRVIYLRSFIAKKSMGENVNILRDKFSEIDFPPGYGYRFAGTAEEQRESMASILMAFILAVILTYMLLAAILNSFIHPLTILVTVPLGLVGVFGTLFFSGLTINIMSMMAVVMLVGIVVNNGILIIDYALQKIRTSDKSLEECIHEGSDRRFRMILMTNIAILAGIMPQVLGGTGSEFLIPIAAATMGGVAVSTVFTFFSVPALFLVVERNTERASRFVKGLFARK